MEISGLPLHPLVVHAVVVFVPLAALAGLGYALVPRWRRVLWWPLLVCTVVAVGGAVVAAKSGEDLATSRGLDQLAAVRHHMTLGTRLRNLSLLFAVAVALGLWLLRSSRARTSRRGLDLVVAGLLVVASVAALVAVVMAGDSGARAVWG